MGVLAKHALSITSGSVGELYGRTRAAQQRCGCTVMQFFKAFIMVKRRTEHTRDAPLSKLILSDLPPYFSRTGASSNEHLLLFCLMMERLHALALFRKFNTVLCKSLTTPLILHLVET